MKILTEKLTKAVGTAIQGAGFNKFLLLTTMIGLHYYPESKSLWLTTTDKTNTLDVKIENLDSEKEFNVTIDAETFSKLVSKVTSKEVELIIENDTLIVNANGTYKFPLIADEDGLVKFPKTEIIDINNEDIKTISLSTIKNIHRANKAALFNDKDIEQDQTYLTGYYCGKETVSTDATIITFNNKSITNDSNPLLLSARTVNLLVLNTEDSIMFKQDGNKLQFETDDILITTTMLSGIEDYPINEIRHYLDEDFPSKCKISKDLLLDILDRLELFIEPYDKNGAYFTFKEEGITIHSKKDSSIEVIKYIESTNFESFICCVDIPALKEQIQAISEDTISLSYGNENAIRLDCGDVIQILALEEDEEK